MVKADRFTSKKTTTGEDRLTSKEAITGNSYIILHWALTLLCELKTKPADSNAKTQDTQQCKAKQGLPARRPSQAVAASSQSCQHLAGGVVPLTRSPPSVQGKGGSNVKVLERTHQQADHHRRWLRHHTGASAAGPPSQCSNERWAALPAP